MGKVVEIDCEKSMKLETSRNVTKSKRSLRWCRSISKNICARFITVSVKKLLHYRAGLLQYRAVLLHYRAVITVSGVYYIIGWYNCQHNCIIIWYIYIIYIYLLKYRVRIDLLLYCLFIIARTCLFELRANFV